jgi:hypothetical protein
MSLKKAALFFQLIFLLAALAYGQETLGTYQVRVAPDRSDWSYELNQPVRFSFTVTLNNIPVSGLPLRYACGPEAMPPVIQKTVTTDSQPIVVDAGTMKEPGFLRCIATVVKDGRTYRGLATAAFRPERIAPVVTDPKDFDEFWNNGKTELARIPLDEKMEYLPSSSTSKVDVYHVSFQNIGVGTSKVSRIYGILAVPKTSDPNRKFPALLRVPGAGVRP